MPTEAIMEDDMTSDPREEMHEESPETEESRDEMFAPDESEKHSKKKIARSLKDLPGVGPSTAQKLELAGFRDLLSIAVSTPGELVAAAELTEITAKKAIAMARESLQMDFESGDEVLKRRESILRITTGSKELDKLMGEGIETGAITEAYGAYGVGKSQLAHALAVRCQLPPGQGGAGGVAVFIDTESTFRPERIVHMAKAIGMDPQQALKNIRVARAFNSDHQTLLTEKVEDLIKNQGLNVKLVIVDSLTAHFRAEFVGRGTLADRQQKLNKHMHTLAKLAMMYNVAVYVTNQVMSKPDVFFGDPNQAVGGNIVAHNSTYRIYLRRGKKGTRVAKMIDAPNMPEIECIFKVDEDGVKDV